MIDKDSLSTLANKTTSKVAPLAFFRKGVSLDGIKETKNKSDGENSQRVMLNDKKAIDKDSNEIDLDKEVELKNESFSQFGSSPVKLS